jgi:DNA-binding transcriptional regulator YiaG
MRPESKGLLAFSRRLGRLPAPRLWMIGPISMLSAPKRSAGANVIDMLVGASLSEIRSRAGMSQADLAEQLRTTVETVERWETGQTHIEAHQLISLSRLLQVSVGEFWSKL